MSSKFNKIPKKPDLPRLELLSSLEATWLVQILLAAVAGFLCLGLVRLVLRFSSVCGAGVVSAVMVAAGHSVSQSAYRRTLLVKGLRLAIRTDDGDIILGALRLVHSLGLKEHDLVDVDELPGAIERYLKRTAPSNKTSQRLRQFLTRLEKQRAQKVQQETGKARPAA
eukprot:TRINITY_DN29802_c0_g1_i1.p2 TRINITY_DN29802_c0_g1~~TRINITY_DN29802_c0_g1_i1.p2  ORF type:complete len:168 (-),score=23.02 TRINITY_DN29802_c0_g1_i1:442-945(-)